MLKIPNIVKVVENVLTLKHKKMAENLVILDVDRELKISEKSDMKEFLRDHSTKKQIVVCCNEENEKTGLKVFFLQTGLKLSIIEIFTDVFKGKLVLQENKEGDGNPDFIVRDIDKVKFFSLLESRFNVERKFLSAE